MNILVTNDDGYFAKGIAALVAVAKEFGNVTVVAPDKPQSGMGHAITIDSSLRVEAIDIFGSDVTAYKTSGTPVDCVKLATDKIFKTLPDLCLSGFNHGSNASINIIYSGTMSAAVEGSIEGIPSIGFSLLDYTEHADFEASKHCARYIIQQFLKNPIPLHNLLNVNIPKLKKEEIKGVKICRQAAAKWNEDYQERVDPRGKKYYWMTGVFDNKDKGTDTDIWALDNGYVSVVPVQYDLTAHGLIPQLQQSWDSGINV
jgi:5'-nucleotidase